MESCFHEANAEECCYEWYDEEVEAEENDEDFPCSLENENNVFFFLCKNSTPIICKERRRKLFSPQIWRKE